MKLTEQEMKEAIDSLQEMNETAKAMTPQDWKNLYALLSFPNARQVLEKCPHKGYKLLGLALLAKK